MSIKDNPDKPWDWHYLSLNSSITMDNIKDNPDKPWDWEYLSMNPSINMEIIKDNPDKPWNWKYLYKNPNITIDIIEDNLDKHWEHVDVYDNPFTYDYETQVDILYYQKHKSSFSHVFETLLHPDNIEFSKKLGVYSDMSVCWKAF